MISVLIPVKDGGDDLVRCLDGIARQEVDEDLEVVIVDSGSTDGSADVARSSGARVHLIRPEEFRHGSARNLAAGLARGEVLVFTTQDAVAVGTDWLRTLVAPLRDPGVAGVYGRQLPYDHATPPERYFLEYMYGPDPRVQRLEDPSALTYEATMFSNVNSAIARSTWKRYPFRDDLIMSEDQEWSRRLLLDGFSIVYEPTAAVWHSHSYSFRGAFRRFFDSGASADSAYIAGRASRAALRGASIRYARGELRWLWATGNRRWLPYAAVYELTKFVGLQIGRRQRHLPRAFKQRLSSNASYWSDADRRP